METAKKNDIEIAKKLSEILSTERSSNCTDWIAVGYCLHTIGPSHLKDYWIKSVKNGKCLKIK